jgi:hypothetical protein
MLRSTLQLLLSGLISLSGCLPLWAGFVLGDREIMTVTGPHWKITWTVSEEKFITVSHWDSKNDPPLSPAKAVEIARSYLRSRHQPAEASVFSISLQRQPDPRFTESNYFYYIRFDDSKEADPEKNEVSVVVLLDGTVVPPTRSAVP